MRKFLRILPAIILSAILAFTVSVPANAYVVKQGDTLNDIAKENGVTVDELVEWNNIQSRNLIYPGQHISIPPKNATVLTASDIKVLKDFFDADFYAKKNPDVVEKMGTDDEDAMFAHFLMFGLAELRQPNMDFNVTAYAAAYNDLSSEFGTDVVKYYRHYDEFGKREKRAITSSDAFIEAGYDARLLSGQKTVSDESGRPQFAEFYVESKGDFYIAPSPAPAPEPEPEPTPPSPNSYTITFSLNGRGDSSLTPASQTIEKGGKVTKPDNPADVGDFKFAAWYTDSACTDLWDFDNDEVSSDLTLYVKWMNRNWMHAAFNSTTGQLVLYHAESLPASYGAGFEVYEELIPLDISDDNYSAVPWYPQYEAITKVTIDQSMEKVNLMTSTSDWFCYEYYVSEFEGFEYLDTSNVTNMYAMFYETGYYVTEGEMGVPNVSNWDTSKVTDMGYMFYCFGYETGWDYAGGMAGVPDVSNWDTSNVESFYYMFAYYAGYDDDFNMVPDVSRWDTGKVTDMYSMFYCYAYYSYELTKVPDVSGWNTESVTNLSYMFAYYGNFSDKLSNVPNVSEWNTGSVTDMSYMFNCYGYGYDTSYYNRYNRAFNAVPDVSGWNTENVQTFAGMFEYYGYASENLDKIPDVSKWTIKPEATVTNIFHYYGYNSSNVPEIPTF